MTPDELEKQLEDAVAELYKVFFRLREAKLYQEEYDSMGTIISMLTEDRQHLRKKYEVKF